MGERGVGGHAYGLKTWRKAVYLGYAVMFLGGAGFCCKLAINPIGRDFVLSVGALLLAGGLLMASLAFRSRLTLDRDRIELRSSVRTYSARREEIDGLRTIQDQYGRRTRICLKSHDGDFNISDGFTGNDELKEWLKEFPDLDQRDADQIEQELNQHSSLEPESSAGWNALKHAKAWAIGLSILTGAASIPVLFLGRSSLYIVSLIALALSLPLGIVLVHVFPLWFTIFKRKPDPRADIGFLVLWPGFAMLMSNQTGSDPTHLVDMTQMIYWVLFVWACYVAALFGIAWRSPTRWALLAVLLIFGCFSGVGLANILNTLPDHSAARLYRAQVVKRYESHGKSTTYYLRLTPWGPLGYFDDVDVPKRFYDGEKVGDLVCTGLHPGFLHAPWYTVTACPQDLMMPVFPGQ